MELLQRGYIIILSPFIPISNKLNKTVKKICIILCVAIISLIGCIYSVVGHDDINHKYAMAYGSVLFLILIFISLPSQLKIVRWRLSYGILWILFCSYLILSDFLVKKQEPYLGWLLLIGFTMFFFVMHNYQDKEFIWQGIFGGIKLFYFLSLIFSILFRTYDPAYRYMGPFNNPNKLGMFLIIVVVIFLYEIDQYFQGSISYKKLLLSLAGLSSCVYLLLIAKARTSLIACLIPILIWFIFRVVQRVFCLNKEMGKRLFILTGSSILMFIFICFTLQKAFQIMPQVVDHPIKFKNDTFEKRDSFIGMNTVVYAKDKEEQNLVQDKEQFVAKTKEENILSNFFREIQNIPGMYSITSGRIGCYRLYSTKLNKFGHEKQNIKSIDGIRFGHAHNNLIQIGYDYGIPAMILYFLLTVYLGILLLRRMYLEKTSISVFCFLFFVGFFLGTISEMMLVPFQYITVFGFWLLCGEGLYAREPEYSGKC
ncbi:O-antigen ligase family protein [Anaerosacchariphilus polymeriproducens]|uniref:O-antigen ligase domain-containing protein n=1 Tax=Anaerosacchariphilus polymeriproducens TaxID=1812858 RepID=A0A371ARE5_9FIRM|nr:O-antigen ligase family protein [Anaerosacchariphilus polymeriproducens]RDU22102.1 hypothetical protein DWV06_16365 [Anaerosacchariphilus polymeriproducens]